MFFIGDVAIPDVVLPRIEGLPECFRTQVGVANLEGTLVTDVERDLYTKSVVFNGVNALAFLEELGVKAVTLGNNHITDVPQYLSEELAVLDAEGIGRCGAGLNASEAALPAVVNEKGREFVLLSFGWDVVSCVYARASKAGVNPLEKRNVLSSVRKARAEYPSAKIVVLPHWDYELEAWPMPMHRVLAREAIEAGADAVIGCHPHCVQGYEEYQGKPVFYSLGNWFFAEGVYMGGRTRFPARAHREMALEWSGDEFICHWFDYDPNAQRLVFDRSESVGESSELDALTPFKGMDDVEYTKWFRKNRVKKKALPVFSSYEERLPNASFKHWVKFRGFLLSLVWDTGLMKRRRDQ